MTYSERNYGAGDPDCPICHGVGYIRYDVPDDHPDFGKVYDCECRQVEVEAERAAYLRRLGGLEHLENKTFETFNPEGAGRTLPDKLRGNLKGIYERAREYAENPVGWLVFTGGYGCGKTHLAAAIANQQIEAGNRVLFVTVPDLLDHLRRAFGSADDEEGDYSSRFEEVRSVPLLILDDLGIESPTPWATEKLYQVLNYRYNARMPTVITTNHSLEDLELRLRSRLSDPDVTELLPILAPDYRRGGAEAELGDLNNLSLYSHLTFSSFEQRRDLPAEERNNLKKALELAGDYARMPQGWLVLLGTYGCGKTHLAAAIANANRQQGTDVLFVTVPDLLDHLRAAFAPNSHTPYDKRFDEVKRASLLILDDLGTESATPWAKEKLYQLFNYRYNAQLPTVITTGKELEELDPRLVTRMRDKRLCRMFSIQAPAYLGQRPE
jgi:DNA replication protein DnaC